MLIFISSGIELAASTHSGLWPSAISHVSSRPHLAPRVLPFTSVTHFLHGLILISPARKDERLSRPSWLTYSVQFTHKVVTVYPQSVSQVQDRDSLPVKTDVLPTVLYSGKRVVIPSIHSRNVTTKMPGKNVQMSNQPA